MRWDAKAMYCSCLRKVKFKNFEDAKKRAEKYNQRIYLCPLCGYYHLTSKLEVSE